jgi:spore germination protein KB
MVVSELLYSTDYIRLVDLMEKTWPWYSQIVELLIPALVLLVAVIRKKGGAKNGNPRQARGQV